MSFSYVRKGSINRKESVPHESRIVDKQTEVWRLDKYSNFDQVATAWATNYVDPEIVSYVAPLGNINDRNDSAQAVHRMREMLTPRKEYSTSARQAIFERQQAEADNTQPPQTPINDAVMATEGKEDEHSNPTEGEFNYRNLTKLTPIQKVSGQISTHLCDGSTSYVYLWVNIDNIIMNNDRTKEKRQN